MDEEMDRGTGTATEEHEPRTYEEPAAELPPPVRRDEKFLAAISHFAIAAVTPIVWVPLLIWLIEKDKPNASAFVVRNAKQAMVFQLIVAAAVVVLSLTIILSPLALLVGLAGWIYGIVGGFYAAYGKHFSYIWVGNYVDTW